MPSIGELSGKGEGEWPGVAPRAARVPDFQRQKVRRVSALPEIDHEKAPRMPTIADIQSVEDIEAVRALVLEFTDFVITQHPAAKTSKAFEGLEAELAGLPGIFGPPDGAFLLCRVDGVPAGCVGLRKHGEGVCEVKRMYVSPAFRGQRLGDALVVSLIDTASALGYRKIVLDTFHTLKAAHYQYRKAGFLDVTPTFDLPPDLVGKVYFMELALD